MFVSRILFFFIALETYAAPVKITSAGCEVLCQMRTPCPTLRGQLERAASEHNDTPPFQAQVAQVWSSLGEITLHSGACAGCPGGVGVGNHAEGGAGVGQGLAAQEVPELRLAWGGGCGTMRN